MVIPSRLPSFSDGPESIGKDREFGEHRGEPFDQRQHPQGLPVKRRSGPCGTREELDCSGPALNGNGNLYKIAIPIVNSIPLAHCRESVDASSHGRGDQADLVCSH
jgi:hypothetical protein